MLQDYSKGIFHEPFFYGQDYNFPLEVYGALLPYWLGMPANIALPLVTVLFTYTPFMIIATQCYKRQQFISAVVMVFVLNCMSIQYDLIVSISRGFVQGIFTASLALLLLKNIQPWKLGLIGFLLGMGFFINPNSLFLSICILFILWDENKHSIRSRQVLVLFLGLIISFVINYQMNLFYVVNPNFNLHFKEPMRYDISDIKRLFALDAHWVGLTPFIWHFASLLLLIWLVAIFYFVRIKQKSYVVFTSLLFLLILVSLPLSKCGDGTVSFLFPYSRFYLTIPIVLALLLTRLNGIYLMHKHLPVLFWMSILFIACGYTVYKVVTLPSHLKKQFSIDAHIQIIKVSELKKKCSSLQQNMRKHSVYLAIACDRDDKLTMVVLVFGKMILLKQWDLNMNVEPGVWIKKMKLCASAF